MLNIHHTIAMKHEAANRVGLFRKTGYAIPDQRTDQVTRYAWTLRDVTGAFAYINRPSRFITTHVSVADNNASREPFEAGNPMLEVWLTSATDVVDTVNDRMIFSNIPGNACHPFYGGPPISTTIETDNTKYITLSMDGTGLDIIDGNKVRYDVTLTGMEITRDYVRDVIGFPNPPGWV
jgi:hypothetical protein